MPHLNIQHSDNLPIEFDLNVLCRTMNLEMQATGIFPVGGIRVRTVPAPHFSIADDHPENRFVDIVLRIGEGRTMAEKTDAGAKLMAKAEAFFAPLLAGPHFALSFEIVEIDKKLSWKTNTIHPRLK